jgi:hypothetical protein
MLVVSISVAAVLSIGVSIYFAVVFKQQRDTLDVKFKQAQAYADSTAKANITLTSANRIVGSEIISAKERIEELTKQLNEALSSNNAKSADLPKPSAPSINAKKAGRGRPAKKAVA